MISFNLVPFFFKKMKKIDFFLYMEFGLQIYQNIGFVRILWFYMKSEIPILE